MKSVRFIIIGAGPTGLALAHALHDGGVPLEEIVVLEKEEEAGGLCRSAMVDGAPIDIGGGHFLDVKHRAVLDFVFRFMPESEWVRHDRVSKIHLRGQMIDHPLESNLWQLDMETQVDFLENIAQAGCIQGSDMPLSFAAWIRWKLGDRIADEYMLPYNRKIWSMDPDLLGTYWLHKLPNVSFREILQSCLAGQPLGALPAHGVFLYPKCHGYGEVWRRMGEALGDSLVRGVRLESIKLNPLEINGQWRAEHVFSSAPWSELIGLTDIPESIVNDIQQLQKVAIDIDYEPETLSTDAHWIYEPSESVTHHRKLIRSNFSIGSRGYWTETNSLRSHESRNWRHHNPFAYPVNTIYKPACISRILEWAKTCNITGVGRWGTWEHMNSDIAVLSSLNLAKDVLSPQA